MDWGLVQTILTLVFGIIAIISIIVAIRLARRKKPVWAYHTRHIIGRGSEAPLELKLVFENREVANVYRTDIIFFNKGNEVIEASDVVTPIIVCFEDSKILKEPNVISNKSTIEFRASRLPANGAIALNFKYLGHNDGAIVEVWHNKSGKISLSGDIKNAKITQEKELVRTRPEGFRGALVVTTGVTAMLTWIWWYIASKAIQTGLDLDEFVPALIMSILFISFTFFGMRRLLRYKAFPSWSRLET